MLLSWGESCSLKSSAQTHARKQMLEQERWERTDVAQPNKCCLICRSSFHITSCLNSDLRWDTVDIWWYYDICRWSSLFVKHVLASWGTCAIQEYFGQVVGPRSGVIRASLCCDSCLCTNVEHTLTVLTARVQQTEDRGQVPRGSCFQSCLTRSTRHSFQKQLV